MTIQVERIVEAVGAGHSLIVEAGAGCGKTTAIVNNISPKLPHNTLFLAFNKSIQMELEGRLPGRQVKTFHSLALANLTRRLGKLKVEPNKYKNNPLLEGFDYDSRSLVSDIISAYQLSAAGAEISSSQITHKFFHAILEGRIEELEPTEQMSIEMACDHAYTIFSQELKKPTSLTYDDMLWFLVHYSHEKRWSLKDYACVVIDEAQDVSPIRLAILKRLSNRVIAVGDSRQAIYKFAGAMSSALNEIQESFNAVRLPLSVTWRCSLEVVKQAELILGEKFLQPRPNAPEGYVGIVSSLEGAELDQRCMILCRTNKPLVMLAVSLLKKRVPFRMLSDFPNKLIKKVTKLLRDWDGGMATFRRAVFNHYEEILVNIKNPSTQARYEDERDTILALAEQATEPQDVVRSLEAIVNSKFGVLLTTGHKAKGLEAETVYIISPDLIPAPWIPEENTEDMEQERNIHYVMATRAKTSLYYVGGMPCQRT